MSAGVAVENKAWRLIESLCPLCPQYAIGEAMSRRIRAVFGARNFLTIVRYNVLALNSLEFGQVVGKRLIVQGKKDLYCSGQHKEQCSKVMGKKYIP